MIIDITPNDAEIAADTGALATRLAALAVVDTASCTEAVRQRIELGEAMKRVAEFFRPLKEAAHRAHKVICERENAVLAPLVHTDTALRAGIRAFNEAETRARHERERELAEAHRRAREAEAMHEAAALESTDPVLAAALLAEAIEAPAPVVALPTLAAQVPDLKFTRRYLWRYVGGPATVKDTPPGVLARTVAIIPREYLIVDEKKIGAFARAMKGSGAIPGIEFYSVDDPTR
jgi:hypothetical protein